jgi:CRISPR-associated protein Cmr2
MKQLCIFQIGPVQEFIESAKKTQDLWSGSFLLSYLSSIAIATIERKYPNSIIYPDLTHNPIFPIVENNPDTSTHDFANIHASFYGTTPNRFVALLSDNNTGNTLDEAKKNIEETYELISDKAKAVIEKHSGALNLKSDNVWNAIWSRQKKNIFDVYWVVKNVTDPNNTHAYSTAYVEAERIFSTRKNIRNFTQSDTEPGYKCTICGIREQLTITNMNENWHGYKDFWANKLLKHLNSSPFKHAFREGERLCSVCTTKRLAPQVYFKVALSMPSTSSIAVSPVLYSLAQRLTDTKTRNEINQKINSFKDSFNELKLDLFPVNLTPIPKIKSVSSSGGEVFKWDGDAFIRDTYQPEVLKKYRSDKAAPGDDFIQDTRDKLSELLECTTDNGGSTYKYYAVIMADGDDMGRLLGSSNSIVEHKDISRRLGIFSSQIVPYAVESLHCAKIVYWGGDEGLVLVSLEDLLSLMRYIRTGFSGQWRIGTNSANSYSPDFVNMQPSKIINDGDNNPVYETMGGDASLSMGVVIAHHQQSLLQVLSEVRMALQEAKSLTDKNAFCISTMKRSGGTVRAVSKWTGNNFDVIGHLMNMQNLYRQNVLSDRWLYDLYMEKDALSRLLFPYTAAEILRIIKRHTPGINGIENLSGEFEELLSLTSARSGGDNIGMFINLEQVAAYIARGGGS